EAILSPRLRTRPLAARYDGTPLCLSDGKDLIDVADLHRWDAVVSKDLVQQRKQVLPSDLPRGADRHLPLDAGVDRVADAECRREAVDHLPDVGPLEVVDHGFLFFERLLALCLRCSVSGRSVLRMCHRWGHEEPWFDHR